MSAFIDARCPKCKGHVGWYGSVLDRPPCPKCGHQIPQDQLEIDRNHMDEFRKLLATRAKDASTQDLRVKRKAAGLTLVHVSEATRELKFGGNGTIALTPTDISRMERGEIKPTEEQAAILDRIYNDDTIELPKEVI